MRTPSRKRCKREDHEEKGPVPFPAAPICGSPMPGQKPTPSDFCRAFVACLVVTLAAGCAAPGPAPLTPSPEISPNFAVPSARERMVFLARQEWALFGRPVVTYDATGEATVHFEENGVASHEVQPPMLTRVLMYWYSVTRLPVIGNEGELRPWSAAFISWLARGAGLAPGEFPSTVLHWDYIERFLEPRDGDRFAARDPTNYAPRVGDLVCVARSSFAAPGFAEEVNGFAHLRRGPYHCDLVVAETPDGIEAIGGNVSDTLSLVRLPVDARGLLQAHPRASWAAVLQNRDR